MATRKPTQPQAQPANLTAQDMQAAIPKLKRRITALASFDFSTIATYLDPKILALQLKVDDTLVEIFGPNTLDLDRFRVRSLWGGNQFMATTEVTLQETV